MRSMRRAALWAALALAAAAAGSARAEVPWITGPLYLTVDGPLEFFLTTPTVPWQMRGIGGPYGEEVLFTLDAPAYLRATDAGHSGDTIVVNINGVDHETSAPGSLGLERGEDYFGAFTDPNFSHAEWLLGPGSYVVKGTMGVAGHEGVGTNGAVWLVSEAAAAAVPEPAAWLLMIAGFGLAGAALRRRAFATA